MELDTIGDRKTALFVIISDTDDPFNFVVAIMYGEYQKARRDMQEIVTIKANIDTLLGYTEPGRKQEKER